MGRIIQPEPPKTDLQILLGNIDRANEIVVRRPSQADSDEYRASLGLGPLVKDYRGLDAAMECRGYVPIEGGEAWIQAQAVEAYGSIEAALQQHRLRLRGRAQANSGRRIE